MTATWWDSGNATPPGRDPIWSAVLVFAVVFAMVCFGIAVRAFAGGGS